MKKKTIKTILFALVILIVIAAIEGYHLWNRPHINVAKADAIKTDAIILYKSFISDSIKAKATYVNKVLNVSGVVKSVSVNQQHQQVILLKTSEPDGSVNCTMEGSKIKIEPGAKVFIKGICIGYIGGEKDMGLPGDVFLVRCNHST